MAQVKKELAKIITQDKLAADIYNMWIETDMAKWAKAGQFISLFTKDKSKLLPRPISICEINKDEGLIRIVYRVTGKNTGTKEFSAMHPGEYVEIMGPLGNGFSWEGFGDKKIMLVGGGIGIPPMLQLAKELKQCDSINLQMIMGYKDEVFLVEEFKELGDLYNTCEEDIENINTLYKMDNLNSIKGNVMDAINQYNLDADILYSCGPLPMLKAVKSFAESKSITCYISMEEKMACGIGACLACVCKTKEKDMNSNLHKQRICKEGPVFLSTDLDFES